MNPHDWHRVYEIHGAGRTPLEFAIEVYLDRQDRGNRRRFYAPWGLSTKNKLWIPFPTEVRSCCTVVGLPTMKYPWALHRHCRSARHVAMLFDVDERHILNAVEQPRIRSRCCECNRFVRADDYICGRCRENALDNQSS